MLNIFRQRLASGRATNGYPTVVEEPPSTWRGMPRLRGESCQGEAACTDVCPTDAITVASAPSGDWIWTLDRAACLGCGLCIEACPHQALEAETIFELATRSRAALRVSTRVKAMGEQLASPIDDRVEATGARLRARVQTLFGRSLQLRHLDVGSCNGCDWEINTLLNPVYDLQRFGVDIVASPRHADGVLVTGPITRHLEPAFWATYEAVPDPKLVIAVGACACDAGFLAGSYAVSGSVDQRVPVDVYIPGCPPRPDAILHGLLVAMGRRS